ncbi:hypothetical protein Glove_38g61 [Diversispora epigaea]|uniref:Uncharacterized protein n=1 Tax=Diversispora epigaea TaxID=1348612 RepID=A0A397JRZ3_9GLOM|nr:hypothetical protein Glove_38g61 [Diversispora epigaea]
MSTQSEHDTSTVSAYTEEPTVDNQNFQENIDHTPAEVEAPPSRLENPESSENFDSEIGGEEDPEQSMNSVKPRQFFGTDSEDGIETIFAEHQGHSLHEFIGGDYPLRPFIDFDLLQEKLNKIDPKLTRKEAYFVLIGAFREVCIEIYPKWEIKTLTIASSCDQKKMSYHILTSGMKLKNITACALFTEFVCKKLPVDLQDKDIVDNIANKSPFSLQILGTPKIIKETNEHVRPKRAVIPENGTIFDFMLRPPNDEAPVIIVLSYLSRNQKQVEFLIWILNQRRQKFLTLMLKLAIGIELGLVIKLLEEFDILRYELSPPRENFPNTFPLKRIAPAYCPLCEREYEYKEPHNSDNAYVVRNKKSYSFYCQHTNNNREVGSRKPSIKLTFKESVTEQENNLLVPLKSENSKISDPNDHFIWGDLVRMCTSKKKFTCTKVYDVIQTILACVVFPHFSGLNINLVELGGESIGLKSLIDRTYDNGGITYDNIDFMPYSPNVTPSKTNFFNLFLRFKAKLTPQINYDLINPITWHIENIWCNGDKTLSEYHQEIFSGVIFRNFNVILNFRNFSRNITEIFENFRKLLKR